MAESPVQRLLVLLHLIPPASRPLTVSELLDRLSGRGFKVDRRTVQRDLVALSAMYPLVCDEAKERRWSWTPDAERFDLPGMDATTALAFVQAESQLRKLLPPAITQELAPWFARARTLLDGEALGDWARRVRVLETGQPLQVPVIDPTVMTSVSTALLDGKALRLSYASRSKATTGDYLVHPLALIWRGPVAYLVVLFGDYCAPRYLALHRIGAVTVLEQAARTLPGFDLDDWLAQCDFDIPVGAALDLHAEIAQGVRTLLDERPLAPDQRLDPLDSGRHTLRATVANTLQLRWWLLGFGDQVTVLAPAALRDELAATVGRMAAAYGPGAGAGGHDETSSVTPNTTDTVAMTGQTATHEPPDPGACTWTS